MIQNIYSPLNERYIEALGLLSLDSVNEFKSELCFADLNTNLFKQVFLKNLDNNSNWADFDESKKYIFFNQLLIDVSLENYLLFCHWANNIYEFNAKDRFGESFYHSIFRKLSGNENLSNGIKSSLTNCFNEYKEMVENFEHKTENISITSFNDKKLVDFFDWEVDSLRTLIYNIGSSNIFSQLWNKHLSAFSLESQNAIWLQAKSYSKNWDIRPVDVPFPNSWYPQIKVFIG